MWYVYILECKKVSKRSYGKLSFYTGITTDPFYRFIEHRHQYHSDYMKFNRIRPRRIIYLEELPHVHSIEDAELRERQVKNYPKKKKMGLINSFQRLNPELVSRLDNFVRSNP